MKSKRKWGLAQMNSASHQATDRDAEIAHHVVEKHTLPVYKHRRRSQKGSYRKAYFTA